MLLDSSYDFLLHFLTETKCNKSSTGRCNNTRYRACVARVRQNTFLVPWCRSLGCIRGRHNWSGLWFWLRLRFWLWFWLRLRFWLWLWLRIWCPKRSKKVIVSCSVITQVISNGLRGNISKIHVNKSISINGVRHRLVRSCIIPLII